SAEIRRMIELATERIVRYLETLPEQRAVDTDEALERSEELIEDLPEEGTDLEALLDRLFERWIPKGFNAASPGYLAYIPGGGLVQSAAADLIASSINRYVGVFAAAPPLAQLETNVVRWFAKIVGLPSGSGGVLTTGGSMANLIAVVTARRERLPENFLRGTIYVSDQVHHSVVKAAILAGFPARNIRSIETDETFAMRIDQLSEAIDADRAERMSPFMVVASAGTTNTGAIDPLEEIADLASAESLWFHVDAAYGGFFMLTERGKRRLRGIERADSLSLDPHKGLFVPYGSGSLLVRDLGALRRAHSVHADYLPDMQQDDQRVDFCEISPELSRGFRGLRVWLPIKLAGIDAFRSALDEKLDLASHAHERLLEIEEVELVAAPQLSVVAFRWKPAGVDGEELDDLNRELLRRVNERGRVYLTGTKLRDRFTIRICVLSFRTHGDRIEMALEDIEEAMSALTRDRSPGRAL
ncbi:MAG: aminotransferase class I/II-fold pyridoxal phosphate-dependent enzyme, partial [Thermoanaerobaculia bacterium]|nr:aminotransferase class I/II-fold pyridoxal phosphate-dependent enzyme [Thermoanaerobaculia bacterium]